MKRLRAVPCRSVSARSRQAALPVVRPFPTLSLGFLNEQHILKFWGMEARILGAESAARLLVPPVVQSAVAGRGACKGRGGSETRGKSCTAARSGVVSGVTQMGSHVIFEQTSGNRCCF